MDDQNIWGGPIDWDKYDHAIEWGKIKAKLFEQYPDPEPEPEPEPKTTPKPESMPESWPDLSLFPIHVPVKLLPELDRSSWEEITVAHVPYCADSPVDDPTQHSPVDTPNIKFCKVCGTYLESHELIGLHYTEYKPNA